MGGKGCEEERRQPEEGDVSVSSWCSGHLRPSMCAGCSGAIRYCLIVFPPSLGIKVSIGLGHRNVRISLDSAVKEEENGVDGQKHKGF